MGVCWPWGVFVLFRVAIEKMIKGTSFSHPAEPCFHPEPDSKAQAKEGVTKGKNVFGLVVVMKPCLRMVQNIFGSG